MGKIQNKWLCFRDLKSFISNLFRFSNFEFRAFPPRGFTLVEMVVAFGVFVVIMVMATGSLVSILGANYEAQALKTVVNNLHFALENMSRAIRTGAVYHCDTAQGDVTLPRDCAESDPATSLAVLARDGKRVAYQQNGAVLERATVTAGEEWRLSLPGAYVPITAPEIRIEQLRFYVAGTSRTDKEQPRVLIVLRGFVQGKGKVANRFDIETLVSQRLLDI
jgi:prepilin-type N-terminal cleavage/methylation domain-containing protein